MSVGMVHYQERWLSVNQKKRKVCDFGCTTTSDHEGFQSSATTTPHLTISALDSTKAVKKYITTNIVEGIPT